MKKFFSAALILCMILILCACGGTEDDASETTAATTVAIVPTETTEAAAPTETEGEELVEYTVIVVDEEGNPIAGAMVQLCLDTCFPGVTGADGVAKISRPAADYHVSFAGSLPAGYTYSTEEEEFFFEEGSTELTIVLKAEG